MTNAPTGEAHQIGPGGLYLVGPKDRQHIKALTDVHVISVFNPPLTGDEVYDEAGSYPPAGPIPLGPINA